MKLPALIEPKTKSDSNYFLYCFQSVAELEQKWQSEVEEAQQGKLENNTPFFHDYHFFEVPYPIHFLFFLSFF